MKKILTVAICVVALGAGALLGIELSGLVGGEPEATAIPTRTGADDVTTRMRPVNAEDERIAITVYKSPTCGCCSAWVDHLEDNGFSTIVHDSNAMDQIKREAGLPPTLASCHTAFVGDYVIEGHVPAADIKRLLEEQPVAAGLAVPGMPLGSPGMEVGNRRDSYDVLLFQHDGGTRVFQHHAGDA